MQYAAVNWFFADDLRAEIEKKIMSLIKNNNFIPFKLYHDQFRNKWYVNYTANAYRQTTDKLMFKSVISTVR